MIALLSINTLTRKEMKHEKHFLVLLLIIAPLFINSVNACENNAKLVLLKKNNTKQMVLLLQLNFPKLSM